MLFRSEALEAAKTAHPDVVVLDLDMGGEDGAEIIPQLVNDRRTRVLLLTGMRESPVRDAAVLKGASGLVGKEEPAETILKAIAKVHAGELWLDRNTTGRIFVELSRAKKPAVPEDPEREKIASLTAREREIVSRIGSEPGADNRKLAKILNLSEHTLRNHVSRIYDKLGVSNRLELYLYAQKHALNTPSE